MIREAVIEWLVALDHYPPIKEFIEAWGGGVLTILLNANDVIIDDDSEIILVAITNPKLQKLHDESVLLSELPAKGEDDV